MPFSPAIQAAVTKVNKCLRAYLKLTTCDGEELYIKSHDDVATPKDLTSDAGIFEIGSTSQKVNFSSSTTTTGSFSFRILDFDKNFSRWMRGLKQCTMSGSTVSIHIGYEEVAICDYYCAGTYIINNVSTKHKGYTFNARDAQSLGNNDLFNERCYKHFGSLYQESIPPTEDRDFDERESVIYRFEDQLPDDQIWGELYLLSNERLCFDYAIEDIPSKGFTDLGFFDRISEEPKKDIGFLKSGCEIFLVAYAGTWNRDAIFDDPLTDDNEFRSALCGHRYTILQRAVYNSEYLTADDDQKVINDGDEFCIATILDGPANWILNAIMTGNDLDGNEVLNNENNNSLSHAGIDQKFVDLECLEGFDDPLLFVCPPTYKAKAFWQEQILRWLDAYFLVSCEGKLCLTQRERPEDSKVSRVINQNDIIRCGRLNQNTNVVTSLFIAWDYDACNENFLSTTGTFISAEETKCLQKREEECKFIGVETTAYNYQLITQKMCRQLYRDGIPRWETDLTLCIEFADVRPGEEVQLENGLTLDYLGDNLTLNRAFEVSGVTADWRRGTVNIELSTPIKPNVGSFDLANCFRARQPCGTAHCVGRVELNTVIGTNNIAPGQIIDVPAGNYCVTGDLVVAGTLRQSTTGTLNIVATGLISVPAGGKIDTSGMGEPGHTGLTSNSRSAFYGVNQGQGGISGNCGTDFCRCNDSTVGYRCAGRTYRPFDINSNIQTTGIQLAGAGGCNGRESTWRGPFGNDEDRPTLRGTLAGGAGGNGGGGLVLSATSYNLSAGCIDTSGNDGSTGESQTISASDVEDESLTIHAGAGSGGNAGRVLIISDGPVPASIGTTNFVQSFRGLTPHIKTGCHSRHLGSSNVNRQENILQVTQLACGSPILGEK